jgi:hypothetical protein
MSHVPGFAGQTLFIKTSNQKRKGTHRIREASRVVTEQLETRVLMTTTTYMNPAGGDFDAAANWSNGLPTTGVDAVIPSTVGTVTKTTAATDQMASLEVDGSLVLSGGTLNITAGATTVTGSLTFQGGTLSDTALTNNGGTLTTTSFGGTINDITLDSPLTIASGTSLTVTGGLTLNTGASEPAITLEAVAAPATLTFNNNGAPQTLGGTGEIQFGGTSSANNINVTNNTNSSSALTIGSGITIDGASGTISTGDHANVGIINQGLISADITGETITVLQPIVASVSQGTLDNTAGMMSATAGGTLVLNDTFTSTTIGTVSSLGGTLNFEGTYSGGTLALASTTGISNLTGSWNLVGGLIENTTISFSGSAQLVPTTGNGTLQNDTLASNMTLPDGSALTIQDGLVLNNSSITLASTGSSTKLVFNQSPGAQTISASPSTTGNIIFGGTNASNLIEVLGGTNLATGLTIASGVTIHSATANGAGTIQLGDASNPGFMTNAGTISADANGKTITISTLVTGGAFDNATGATLSALNGGTLSINPNAWTNEGTINEVSSTINLGGAFSALGTLTRTAGTVSLTGVYTVNGMFALTTATGSVRLAGGTLINATITFAGGSMLTPTTSGGTLNDCTLDSAWTFGNGTSATITNGMVLNAKITLASTDNSGPPPGSFTTLTFNNNGVPQALTTGSTGEIFFGGTTANPPPDELGDRILVTGNSTSTAVLTIGAGITIDGQNGEINAGNSAHNAVSNNGIINANVSGDTITIDGTGFFDNTAAGTLEASTGATLAIGVSASTGLVLPSFQWSDEGTLIENASDVILGGTFSVLNLAAANFLRTGGTIDLQGIFTPSTGMLPMSSTTGSWLFDGGTIVNAVITFANGDTLITQPTGGTLNNDTLGNGSAVSTLTILEDTTVTAIKNLTLNLGKIVIDSTNTDPLNPTQTALIFDNTAASQTLGGSGAVVFGGSGLYDQISIVTPMTGTGSLTVGSGVIIQSGPGGNSGVIDTGTGTNTALINKGTIAADASGKVVSIGDGVTDTGVFDNQSMLEALNGGILNINPLPTSFTANTPPSWSNEGTITETSSTLDLGGAFAQLGTLTRSAGIINLTGIYELNAPLAFNSTTGSWNMLGGALIGATLSFTGGFTLVPTSAGGILYGNTLNSNLTLTDATNLTIQNGLTLNNTKVTLNSTSSANTVLVFDNLNGDQTLGGTGELVLGGIATHNIVDIINNADGALTIGANILVDGYAGTINAGDSGGSVALINDGTIAADTGAQTLAINLVTPNDGGLASMINNGVLAAGPDKAMDAQQQNPAGTLQIIGNFDATAGGGLGTMQIGIGGTNPGVDFGQIKIVSGKNPNTTYGGQFTLGGTLKAITLNGYVPPLDTMYTVITYNGKVGTAFSAYSLTPPGAVFTQQINSTNVILTGAPAPVAPTVLTNPQNATVSQGNTATFTSTASGFPVPTIQWQVSIDGGVTFTNIPGATSSPLSITSTTPGENGYEYRAVFTNTQGSATSSAATLTVLYAPVITTQPQSQTDPAGQVATFTAAANANPTATVQWQVSVDGGTTFNNIAGATATTYTLLVGAGQNQDQYRAVFTNSQGTATTNAATLTVVIPPNIVTTQLPGTAVIGSSIADQVTVSSPNNPTGTVTFNLYNNATGTGTPLFTDTETLSSGSATSKGYTAVTVGTDYWVDTYNGDPNNLTVTSGLTAEPVTISPASPTLTTTQQPASTVVGSTIGDQATLTGGYNSTGTVTFNLYNNATGTGTPLFTDTETLSGGAATSKSFTTTAAGTDYWVDTYNGDANNSTATSGLAAEPVTITIATPTLTTTQQPASGPIGSTIADTATVSSGYNPTGTVTFDLYNNPNGTGTPLFTDTETLSGGTATSAGYTAIATGMDYWVDTYSGDSNNASVTSGLTAEPVAVGLATPTISTSAQPTLDVVGGFALTDVATVTGGDNPTGTVTFKLYNNATGTGTPLFTETDSLSGGSVTSSSNYIPSATGTDYWVDTYNGDGNNAIVTSGVAAEPVTITPETPTITTAQQPTSAIVGSTIADQASVSGAIRPTGTVTFKLYNNAAGTGTPLFTDTEALFAAGPSLADASSANYTTTGTGTDYWVDTYNGDAGNATVTSGLAAEPVTISAATPTISTTQQPASAGVGSTIADKASVAGGYNTTGTVTFKLYNNATATGTPLFTDTETLSGGTATSANYTATATGTDYWVDTYNGDSNNNTVTSGLAAEPVTITQATATLTTTQQPASGPVGSTIADSATVTGYNPTGTVTFDLYNNSTATGTPLLTDTETLSGGTATSKGFATTTVGTDYWVVSYGGDTNNTSATSSDTAEPVGVGLATPTITTNASPTSTTLTLGLAISDTATITGGSSPTGLVTFNLYNNPTATGTPLFTQSTPLISGTASATDFGVTTAGTFYWVDTYSGDTNNNTVTSGDTAEPVTVSPATATIQTFTEPASATVGQQMISDEAEVAGEFPTGTVTFRLYNNPTGTGTPLFTDIETLGGEFASSNAYTTTAAGTDYWVDTYNGDSNNASVTSGLNVEPVTIFKTNPQVQTTPNPTMATVGTSIADTATVTNGYNPTGTVTFTLLNNLATPVFTVSETLSGGTATATGYATTGTGLWNWEATYNGDSNNSTATDNSVEFVNITTATATISTTQQPASSNVGATIADQATVTGYNPTGIVTFDLYNNSGGTGTPVFTDTETLSGGTATSKGYTTTATGTDYWVDTYNGDINNTSAASGVAAEPVTITSMATPTISTFAVPTGGTVNPNGVSLSDAATVTGGNSPTGTITFNLYNNPTATGTPLSTSTRTVSSANPVTSSEYTATTPGTYYWVDSYSGDPNNFAVTSGDTIEPVVVSQATPTITTTAHPTSTDIFGAASLTDSATVTGGDNPTGTITFEFYNNSTASGTPLFTDTETLAGGTATSRSYGAPAVGTYYWVDSYSGDTDNASVTSGDTVEPVVVTQTTPLIFTNAQPTSAIVGATIADQVTIAGDSATGTVTFDLYNNSTGTGTPLFTDTETLSGGTATSKGFTTTATGTDYWVDTYSGDSNNTPVTSGPAAEPVTINPAISAPVVTLNPINMTVNAGTNVTFTAAATGNPAPTVQWQISTDGGATFTNIGGATSTTLTFTTNVGENGDLYRAVFTNTQGTATTSAATLTVNAALAAPVVTTNPVSQTVTAGTNVTFTAAATGNPTPTVQWQISTNGGTTFTNIGGATSTTLVLNSVTTGMSGDEYRAVFTNSQGTATTTAATLTVNPALSAPVVTLNPLNMTVSSGTNVTFTAAATGTPAPTVQWQVSTDGGTTFTNISGATSTTLVLNSVTTAQSGNLYHAVFTNSQGTATTSPASLTVNAVLAAPVVTTNPLSQTVPAGTNVTFTSAATGNPTPTVQWQISTNGGATFTNIGGATSTTLVLNSVATGMNGYEYRAVFTNSQGNATTTAATLTVNAALSAPVVTTNPVNQTVTSGNNATFTAAATGNPTPTVQWQLSTDGGATFANIGGATSTTLTLTAVTTTMSGYEYRAVFTNSQGTATTTAATLTVNPSTATGITIFGNTMPPANEQNVSDPLIGSNGGVEVGLKFTSDVSGSVTGIRFYKGTLDTGVHTGELWTVGGSLLATATFTSETASGWQTVALTNPVVITANTVYVVSYHTTASYIAYTPYGLQGSGVDNPPLHILANGVSGNDGVYKYGVSAFPTVYNGMAPDYWVDVVFNAPTTPLTVFGSTMPPANQQNVNDPLIGSNGGVEVGQKFESDVAGTITGIRFFKGSLDTGVHTGELWDSAGDLLASATFTNESASGWQTVTFSSPVNIAANTVYVISYHTTASYITYTPNGLSGTITNGPLHILGNGVSGPDGVYKYGASAFPTVYNGQAPNYWVDVQFSTTASISVFGANVPPPVQQNVNDPNITTNGGVEVGMKFESSQAGQIVGARFYKGTLDTGVHTAELWDSAGNLLATATFTNETASGWQTVSFSSPVTIAANTIYIISYHTTAPYIAYTPNGLASSITNGPLTILGNGVSGNDGLYKYGASGIPTSYNGQAPNYWVDVMFV